MSVSIDFYYQTGIYTKNGTISLLNPNIKLALVDKDYIPNLGLHHIWSVPDTWASATVYQVGDKVLPVTPSGFYFHCTTGGTSGVTEPTWVETEGNTTTDGDVSWTAIIDVSFYEVASGDGYTTGGATVQDAALTRTGPITKWDASDVVFTALTKTFKYGVLYIDAVVNLINKPLIAVIDLNDISASSEIVIADAVYNIEWHENGIWMSGPVADICT